MNFRTEIETGPLSRQIDHDTAIFLAGSCFATAMAGKLRRARFRVESNPFGVLYNPLSIAAMFDALAARRRFTPEEMTCRGEVWFSYLSHSSLAGHTAREAADNLNRAAERGAEALERAGCVVITLGTTGIYRLAADGSIAANCHKQPAGMFRREVLGVEECTEALRGIIGGPAAGKQVILTVSPVRYPKDGLAGSMLSKATLIVACHAIAAEYANVDYFPSFEILCDDLRDYRFYGPDMLHPTPQAVDYVWEKFCAAALTPCCREVLPQIERIASAREHRPFDPDGEEYARFRRTMLARAEALQREIPGADMEEDLRFFGLRAGHISKEIANFGA